MEELVSVIMPAYKSQATIKKSIESVLSQSYSNLELIVVVDGVDDSTFEVCSSIKDERLHVYQKENGGVVGAYCYGIKKAKGSFIAFCDSDDTYRPGFLKKGMALLQEKDCDFVSFAYEVVKSNNILPQDKHNELHQDELHQDELNQNDFYVEETIRNTLENGLYDKAKIDSQVIPHLVFNSFIRQRMFILLVLRWNKIYKRSLIDSFVDSLDDKCRQIEDNFFIVNAVLKAQSFYIDNEFICYDYYIGQSSISSGWKDNSILEGYFYTIEKIAELTKDIKQIDPHQADFLAYDNARIVFHRCAKNADYKAAVSLLKLIRSNERVRQVKYSELKMLKNKIYHIGLKLHLDWLLYQIFKR